MDEIKMHSNYTYLNYRTSAKNSDTGYIYLYEPPNAKNNVTMDIIKNLEIRSMLEHEIVSV